MLIFNIHEHVENSLKSKLRHIVLQNDGESG